MNFKKMLLPFILTVIVVIAYVAASFFFCYTTEPQITKGEFPFSITYEYKGETKTLSGVFECEFSSSRTILNEHSRYWDGYARYDNPQNLESPNVVDQSEDMVLSIHENMSAGYFMGDPLDKDYYQIYGENQVAPGVEYYDYINNIELNDENKDSILESLGFKIIDFTYAEPIENSFSASGILYAADNISIFIGIMLIFLAVCLIFVRKDKGYTYTALDKIGILCNFLVGIVALPFISLVCWLYDLNGGGRDIMSQIAYNVPSAAILCLALSVVFRRKGYRKTGFFIQFTGIVLFVLLFVFETII